MTYTSIISKLPEEVAKQAIENDACAWNIFICSRTQNSGPESDKCFESFKREDILVIAGGVIPKQDYEFLFEAGVDGIFGPEALL